MAEPLTLLGVERNAKERDAPARLWWLVILGLSLVLWTGIGLAASVVLHHFG